MKSYVDYITDACEALDRWSGSTSARPTQVQTINLALVMAVTDLIALLEKKNVQR